MEVGNFCFLESFYSKRNTMTLQDGTTEPFSWPHASIITVSKPARNIYKAAYFHSIFSFLWRCGPTRAMASSFMRFLDHTQRRTTVGRTLLDEWSARRRDLYLTKRNTHNRQTSMPPVGFEPTFSGGERPQTYSVDRAVTWTGFYSIYRRKFRCLKGLIRIYWRKMQASHKN